METAINSAPVSILHLEDNSLDAVHFAHQLLVGGFNCIITLVQTREDFLAALPRTDLDLILADYSLPDFSGSDALTMAVSQRPDLPFIFLSGSIGEDLAVKALKTGATDYILKHNSSRLIPALSRALREKVDRFEHRKADAALRVSEERYALASRGSNEGLWDWDLTNDAIHFSDRWKTMLGYGAGEIGSKPEEWWARVHPDDAQAVKESLDQHLKGRLSKFEVEYRILTKRGTYLWAACRGLAVFDAQGKPFRMAGSQGDISFRKRAEEQLYNHAFRDTLTGLRNRNFLVNHLQELLWKRKRKAAPPFSLILIGLDRFGSINSGLGRNFGDRILKETALRFQGKIAQATILARLGGDEFGILVENAETGSAVELVKSLQESFRPGIRIGERVIYLSFSAGIVEAAPIYRTPDEMVSDAGTAMAKAKSLGSWNIAVFDECMRAQAIEQLNLETDLKHAIERKEFRVFYQPIQDLSSGGISGFEALVRWQRPGRGLVLPMEFIPMAEQSHFINEIGKSVLEQACAQLAAWRKGHPERLDLTISVNLSARQFAQPDLIRQIGTALSEADLDPGCLRLEVTETVLMENPSATAVILRELRNSGISTQIDDFGSGNSSLGYLHKFPMQALKIDKSFIRDIGSQGENSEFSATIVNMAHDLRMKVIAKGIETQGHLQALKAMGCDFGQGRFISEPVERGAAGFLMESFR